MWYCDICEKEMNILSKLKHNKYYTHKQNKVGIVVKKLEVLKPEIGEIHFTLRDAFKNCRENFFTHSIIDVCTILNF